MSHQYQVMQLYMHYTSGPLQLMRQLQAAPLPSTLQGTRLF